MVCKANRKDQITQCYIIWIWLWGLNSPSISLKPPSTNPNPNPRLFPFQEISWTFLETKNFMNLYCCLMSKYSMAKCPNSRSKFSIAIQNVNSLQHLKFLFIIQCSCFFNYKKELFGNNINKYEKCQEDSNSCQKDHENLFWMFLKS
jgi:hypothetical protein